MIRFRLKELIAEKEFREQRKVTLNEISEKTGVNRTSLSKMQNPAYRHSTTTAAVDSLCDYFGCTVGELMVHIPELAAHSEHQLGVK